MEKEFSEVPNADIKPMGVIKDPFKGKDLLEIKDNFALNSNVISELLFSDLKVSNPLVSIVLPTYKNRRTIFRAIKSAMNQKNAPDYEILIVDNDPKGNDDFIEDLKKLQSNRIRYYRNKENIGMFGNWNRCVELAKAEEIVFLHSDDMLCDNTLNLLWNLHLKVEKEAAILGDWHTMYEDGHIEYHRTSKIFGFMKPKSYYKLGWWSLFHGESDTGCGELFNKKVLMRIGGWNPELYPGADKSLCVLYQYHSHVYHLNAPLKFLGLGGFQASSNVAQFFASFNYLIRKAIVDRSMKKSKLLKYLISIDHDSFELPQYGVKAVRKLKFHERLLRKTDYLIYKMVNFWG